MLEVFKKRGLQNPVRVFATDINPSNIEVASKARFSLNVAEGLPESLRHDYFEESADGFHLKKTLPRNGRVLSS